MSITSTFSNWRFISDFDVRVVSNGYVVSASGQQPDEDNDWDEDPTEYVSATVVCVDQSDLVEVVSYLAGIERNPNP